jgi:antitoxin MazE
LNYIRWVCFIEVSRFLSYYALPEKLIMIVSKLGDSLIVRLSDDEVKAMGLKEGDQVIVKPVESTGPAVTDPVERRKVLDELRQFRGMMPADFKFNRDEANER